MRKKLFALVVIVVLLGMMESIPPVSAIPPEEELLPLFDYISGNRVGNIMFDPAYGRYASLANMGEQNRQMYYELNAYNPSGVPMTITWGMAQANTKGLLNFNGIFDSVTSAWIKNYGRTGATYSVRTICSFFFFKKNSGPVPGEVCRDLLRGQGTVI